MAHDEKRLYREIKRDVKRQGNKRRRRFLKNLEADPNEFEFGTDASSMLNGMDSERKRARQQNDREE